MIILCSGDSHYEYTFWGASCENARAHGCPNQLSSHEHCCKTLQQPYPHQMYLFITLSILWGTYGETVGYLWGVYAVFMGSYYV